MQRRDFRAVTLASRRNRQGRTAVRPCFFLLLPVLRYTCAVTPKERITELRRELIANPASRQFYQLGELLRREGELAEAVSVLRQGLGHHPRYVAAWVSLGRALLDLQELSGAQAAFGEALKLDPQNPVAWRLLGEALLGLSLRKEALHAFEQALALVPGDEVLEEAVASLKAELAPEAPKPLAGPAAAEDSWRTAGGPPKEPVPPEPFADVVMPPPPSGDDLFPLEAVVPVVAEADAVFAVELTPPPPPPPEAFLVEAAPIPGPPPPVVEGFEPALEPWMPEEAAPPEQLPEPGSPVGALASPAGVAAAAAEAAPVVAWPEPVTAEPAGEPEWGPVAPTAPLPTLAEARAAVNRGELQVAAEMLRRLVEAQPENQEAADLLALVEDMMEPLPPEEPRLSPREKKIAALQRFLANVTLARERARL